MVLTINQCFSQLQKRCEPRLIPADDVTTKHSYLRQTLGNKINLIDDFLIGSYVKNTQIRPRTDIDVFIVLNDSYWSDRKTNDPRRILGFLRHTLGVTYSSSTIRSDGQAVTIEQSDGFKIDVIPAYVNGQNTYLIPNLKENTWIRCNPKTHLRYLTDWNTKIDGKLKPLIKMLKCWSRVNRVPAKSFYIELMIVEAFKSLTPEATKEVCSSYPRAITHIFQQGCILIDEPFYDEVGERVDAYIGNSVKKAIIWKKMQDAAGISTRAWHLQQLGREEASYISWKQLFKNYFPPRSG